MKAHPLFLYFVETVVLSFDDLLTSLCWLVLSMDGDELKKASASTPSANEPAKDLILDQTVQLKSMIKAQISGSSGISDVAFTSVHYEKIRLKKLIMIIVIITEKPFTSK